jgi:hypothetical protein
VDAIHTTVTRSFYPARSHDARVRDSGESAGRVAAESEDRRVRESGCRPAALVVWPAAAGGKLRRKTLL